MWRDGMDPLWPTWEADGLCVGRSGTIMQVESPCLCNSFRIVIYSTSGGVEPHPSNLKLLKATRGGALHPWDSPSGQVATASVHLLGPSWRILWGRGGTGVGAYPLTIQFATVL